ncbi:hypothetical protein [uncultured Paraglaciecola sp.]|uniref:hypothetical protein n=1 Tax=uncultured Paraglaciecola sp. TaxID=1765024 RepID=UPI00260E9E01|nr:hypothetical protein [uncultured Paraglaciecola sp.]
MFKKIILIVVSFAMSISAVSSQMNSTVQVIKINTLNQTLAKQFPIEKSFQGIAATFSNAKVLLDPLEHSIELQLTATSMNQGEDFSATLIFTGDLQYHSFSESYIFENLQLDSFKIENDTFANSAPLIKSIKQSLINDFDDLVLIRIDDLDSFIPRHPAANIKIYTGQLKLIWK